MTIRHTEKTPAYAIGRLHDIEVNAGILAYLAAIDATLAPFNGRFRIHGGKIDHKEGHFHGDLIVIEFPDMVNAQDWYTSPAYQAILPLRTQGATGDVFLIDGVDANHRATDIFDSITSC